MGITIKQRNFEKMVGERSTIAVYNHLGEKVFAGAWAEERAMTPEQVLAAQQSVVISLTSSPGGGPQYIQASHHLLRLMD
jgi:hypothetical protein